MRWESRKNQVESEHKWSGKLGNMVCAPTPWKRETQSTQLDRMHPSCSQRKICPPCPQLRERAQRWCVSQRLCGLNTCTDSCGCVGALGACGCSGCAPAAVLFVAVLAQGVLGVVPEEAAALHAHLRGHGVRISTDKVRRTFSLNLHVLREWFLLHAAASPSAARSMR